MVPGSSKAEAVLFPLRGLWKRSEFRKLYFGRTKVKQAFWIHTYSRNNFCIPSTLMFGTRCLAKGLLDRFSFVGILTVRCANRHLILNLILPSWCEDIRQQTIQYAIYVLMEDTLLTFTLKWQLWLFLSFSIVLIQIYLICMFNWYVMLNENINFFPCATLYKKDVYKRQPLDCSSACNYANYGGMPPKQLKIIRNISNNGRLRS